MQDDPTSIRLWREVDGKVHEIAKDMYGGNINATVNLLVMRGLNYGDDKIEIEAKKNMRRRNDSK
jgi:hypothetical protein